MHQQSLLAFIVVLIVSGCASKPRFSALQPLPEGQAIRLLVTAPSVEAPTVDSDAESVSKGAAGGAGLGAAAGATLGVTESVWCGPYILICAPVFAVAGAGAGVILGGIGGGIGGAIQGLPAEKASALEAIIADIVRDLDVEQTLRDEFARNNRQYWQLSQNSITPAVTFAVEGIFFNQFGNNQLNLQTITSFVVRYGSDQTDETKKILFKFTSEQHHVDFWIADGGANLRQVVSMGLAENIRQAVAVLRGSQLAIESVNSMAAQGPVANPED